MKHALSLCLALLMLLTITATAVGCGGKGESAVTTAFAESAEDTVATITEATTESPYDANGYLKDDIDENLNFGGESFHILAWEHSLPEFEVEEQTGNVIENAIYTRNANTEDRLGVDLEFTIIKGNSAAFQEFCQEVAKSVNAGDGSYDAIGCYLRSAGVMTLQHLLVSVYLQEG